MHECSQVGPGSHPHGQTNKQEKGEITATWVSFLAYSQYLNSSSVQGKIAILPPEVYLEATGAAFSPGPVSPRAQDVWHCDRMKGVFDPVFALLEIVLLTDTLKLLALPIGLFLTISFL